MPPTSLSFDPTRRSANTASVAASTPCVIYAHRRPLVLPPRRLPTLGAVFQQAQRRIRAGVFEHMAHDLQMLLRVLGGHAAAPTAAIIDSRTLQSTPTSGGRAGYDGAKRRNGSKAHAVVDTLGHLLALVVTPADTDDREVVGDSPRPCRRPPEPRWS